MKTVNDLMFLAIMGDDIARLRVCLASAKTVDERTVSKLSTFLQRNVFSWVMDWLFSKWTDFGDPRDIYHGQIEESASPWKQHLSRSASPKRT